MHFLSVKHVSMVIKLIFHNFKIFNTSFIKWEMKIMIHNKHNIIYKYQTFIYINTSTCYHSYKKSCIIYKDSLFLGILQCSIHKVCILSSRENLCQQGKISKIIFIHNVIYIFKLKHLNDILIFTAELQVPPLICCSFYHSRLQ